MKANHLRSIVMLVMIVPLGACAFGERTANLQYPPQASPDVSVVSVAMADAPQHAANKGTIVLARFADVRGDKKIVGHVQNGFGMKTAEVVSPNNIQAWVTDALKWELERRGYRVSLDGGAPARDAVLSGQVIRVYCSAYFEYDGEVTIQAHLARDGVTLLDRAYTGKGGGGLNVAATGSEYARTLSLALQDSLRQLVQDIDRQKL